MNTADIVQSVIGFLATVSGAFLAGYLFGRRQ